jgi:hypothetical protein
MCDAKQGKRQPYCVSVRRDSETVSPEDSVDITEIDLAIMRVAGDLYAARRAQNPHFTREGQIIAAADSVDEAIMIFRETVRRWRDIREVTFEEPETTGDNDNVGRSAGSSTVL